jgi:hypothetical protein
MVPRGGSDGTGAAAEGGTGGGAGAGSTGGEAEGAAGVGGAEHTDAAGR